MHRKITRQRTTHSDNTAYVLYATKFVGGVGQVLPGLDKCWWGWTSVNWFGQVLAGLDKC
jgi:hypothetical protein